MRQRKTRMATPVLMMVMISSRYSWPHPSTSPRPSHAQEFVFFFSEALDSGDEGQYLRVYVYYTDGGGNRKRAVTPAIGPVRGQQ